MREIDTYSYNCGIIDCFNEMIKAEVKQFALSHTCPTPEQRDEYLDFCRHICAKYDTKFFPEDELIVTDLFEQSRCVGQHLIIFYSNDEIMQQYEELKSLKKQLVQSGSYHGEARWLVAYSFGKLLGYTDEAIEGFIDQNDDKEEI